MSKDFFKIAVLVASLTLVAIIPVIAQDPGDLVADLSTSTKVVEDASGDGVAQVGEILTFTITITNSGDTGAAIMLTDTLMSGLTYVESSLDWFFPGPAEVFTATFTDNVLVAHTLGFGSLVLPEGSSLSFQPPSNVATLTFAVQVSDTLQESRISNAIELRDQYRAYDIPPAVISTSIGYQVFLPYAAQDHTVPLMVYKAPNCDYGGEFLKMEALDELTVRFTLCAPDVAFPSKVAFSAFAIHSSDYLQETGGGGDLIDNPVGTGPYKIQEWRRDEQLIMERNPNYWGEAATADTLVFRWNADATQRLSELQSRAVDGIDNPSPDDYETIEADENLTLYPREALNVFYLGMNNWYPPFDNEKVRQAIAMGIDRQRIVDNFYPASSTVASHFAPCAIPGGCEGEAWYTFNVTTAQTLLAEAGYPNGFSTQIFYRDVFRSYLPEPGLVAQDIQTQLKDNLNIDAEVILMESGAFVGAVIAGELDGFHLLGWGADHPDQTNFLDPHFGKDASDQFGDGFPDIWDALNRAGALADQAERNVIYAQANNLIKQHVPMVPVAHGGSAVAYNADVEGGHASPLGNEYLAAVDPDGRDTFVWMQNAEPVGLYCADETDGESHRACGQINESLLAYEVGGTAVQPSLTESYEANDDLTVWTFNLREGVTFHDGSALDAIDVLMSYVVQWDAAHPLHVGRQGGFAYWPVFFGSFLNAP